MAPARTLSIKLALQCEVPQASIDAQLPSLFDVSCVHNNQTST